MANNCKYYKLIRQVSYNGGQTWQNLDETMKGDLYEVDSQDCSDTGVTCDPIYQWVEGSVFCVSGDIFTSMKEQVSNDCGITWVDTEAETITYFNHFNSSQCGYNEYPLGTTWYEESHCTNCYGYIKRYECYAVCVGSDKYKTSKVQISYDDGATWEYEGGLTQTLIEYHCEDCGGNVTPMSTDAKMYYLKDMASIPTNVYCNSISRVLTTADTRNTDVDYQKIKYVSVGNCITTLGENAFFMHKNLKRLVLPPSIINLGGRITSQENSGLTTVISQAVNPPLIFSDNYGVLPFHQTSDYTPIEHIYVPSGSVDTYKNDKGWETAIPTVTSEKKYLYNYIRLGYESIRTTVVNGITSSVEYGVSISSIDNYYSLDKENWSTDINSIIENASIGNSIYHYMKINYTDGNVITTKSRYIGDAYYLYRGPSGDEYKKINSVTNYYMSSFRSVGVTLFSVGWNNYADKIVGY